MSERLRYLSAMMMIAAQIIKDEVKRGHREQANYYAAWLQNIVDRWFMEGEKMAEDMTYDSCNGCRHNLGGGCCRINEEAECGAGDRELWEEMQDE